MNANVEQEFLSEITEVNASFWADRNEEHNSVKERLIRKFGTREKAMEETFFLLWRGFLLSIQKLEKPLDVTNKNRNLNDV